MESEYKQSNVELEGGFDFIKFLMNCLRQWPWFIISVIFCVGIAAYKILTTPPVYQRGNPFRFAYSSASSSSRSA